MPKVPAIRASQPVTLPPGRRHAAFNEEDETLVTALSAAAGVAIENAQLFDAAHRQERWLYIHHFPATSIA